MLASIPDFTPMEFHPALTQTVCTVKTLDKGVNGIGMGFTYFQLNERVLRLLQEFKALQANWDEEGALPPSRTGILQAEYLVRLLKISGQKVFHVAPGPNGEIMVDLREKGKSVEILFYPTKAKFVKFPTVGNPIQGEFLSSQLPKILKWLNE